MSNMALLRPQTAEDPSPAAAKSRVTANTYVPDASTWWRFRRQCLRTDCGYPFCKCFPMLEAD